MGMDIFSQSRLKKIILEHRQRHAQFPTLKELEGYGFDKEAVAQALKENIIEQLYVNMTTGAVVKVYKIKSV